MSRSGTARLARNSTSCLLLLLCTALLAWRIDSRVEQYHPSDSKVPNAVVFFDANERNVATLDEAYLSQSPRFLAELSHLVLDVDDLVSAQNQLMQTNQYWPETPPVLSRIVDVSVTLLPNPPPTSLA